MEPASPARNDYLFWERFNKNISSRPAKTLKNMKPEFSEVLMPVTKLHTSASTDSSIRLIERERSSKMDKCFITAAIVFAFVVAIVTTAFIVRYEDKLSNYESRIGSLEKELAGIYELWEEEYGPLHVNEKDFEYEMPTHQTLFDSDENSDDYASKEDEKASHEEKEHGNQEVKIDMTRSRKKRQIPIQDLPAYGPEVERTADGVPILERSYLARDKNEPVRPAAAFFRYEQPATTESEGLRLYEGLVATGGRNEPRSLDHFDNSAQNGILPHHRTSASWSERDSHQTRRRSSSIQLKSGDTSASDLPSGFGESTGPSFSEEVSYRRSSSRSGSGRRGTRKCVTTVTNSDGTTTTTRNRNCIPTGGNQNSLRTNQGSTSRSTTQTQTRSQQSSSTSNNGYIWTGPRAPSDTPAASAVTYHRRSRVPSSDFLVPETNLRSLTYPPITRLGRGDGEVIARVLQSDHENEDLTQSRIGQSATETASEQQTDISHQSSSRQQGSRRVTPIRQSGQQSAHKSGRKMQHHSNRQREYGGNSGSINIVRADAWVESPGKPVAAHYVADVSNYTTSHRHYEGNGRLRNVNGIFASWKPSDWMESTTSEDNKNFVLNQNGVLTIKKPGLYYIYAQIHYLDDHDINGYVVQVNTSPFLQCTTMTETHSGGSKSNSCFTAGITQLKENDRVLVKDIETNRYSIFKPEKSFFGLMKIGDM